MKRTNMTVNIHPGDRPQVKALSHMGLFWLEVRDEADGTLVTIFLDRPMLAAFQAALADADAQMTAQERAA